MSLDSRRNENLSPLLSTLGKTCLQQSTDHNNNLSIIDIAFSRADITNTTVADLAQTQFRSSSCPARPTWWKKGAAEKFPDSPGPISPGYFGYTETRTGQVLIGAGQFPISKCTLTNQNLLENISGDSSVPRLLSPSRFSPRLSRRWVQFKGKKPSYDKVVVTPKVTNPETKFAIFF